MAQRTTLDAMAAVPRLLAPRSRALVVAQPLLARHSSVRFLSSEAAAAAAEEQQHQSSQPAHSQHRAPHSRPSYLPPADPWNPATSTHHARRPIATPDWLARPGPAEGGSSSARGSIASNPYQQASPYPQFRSRLGGSGGGFMGGLGGSFGSSGAGTGAAADSDRDKFARLGLNVDFPLSQILSGMDEPLDLKPLEPPPVLLRPVSGKTIHCGTGMDPTRAFAALNRLTALEATALTQRRQRFHERPGLKRKRLKSERWRKRFAVGFSSTVKRVQDLAKQGW